MDIREINKAIEMLEKANNEGVLLNKNELVQAYKTRGLIQMQIDYHAEALDDYNRALEIINDMQKNEDHIDENANAEVCAARGITCFMLGELESASRDLNNAICIWKTLKNKGIPINEEMLENANGIKAMIITFSNEEKDEAIEYFNDDDADSCYFAAINYMQKEENDKAITNFSRCINLLSRTEMQQAHNDDLKTLSSAYMCRGEIYCRNSDDENKALEDYSKAIIIEELLQKKGAVMNNFDKMDAVRLYIGRAWLLCYLGNNENAISDLITALRLNKSVFNSFPDAQEDYYEYLDKLIDCMIEQNIDLKHFNDTLQEFLFPLISIEKDKGALEKQNIILERVNEYIKKD